MSSPEESGSSPPAPASGAAAPAQAPASPATAPNNTPPPASAAPAAGAAPQVNLAELLALAKTVLAQQQQQQQHGGAGAAVAPQTAPATPAVAEPPATEPRAWERKKFFKLTAEQSAAAAAAKAASPFAPAEPTDPAAGASVGAADLAYGAPAAAALATDPLAPIAATDGMDSDADPLLAGDDVPRRRRGARITPQLGHTARAPRRASRLPLWISAITLVAGLGLGWVIYPRLQKPVPPPESPSAPTPGNRAPAAEELMALPPLPPDSVAARASAPETATVRALALVDQGMAAEKARETEKAARFYEQAFAEDARVPGAAYRLAELSMRKGDLSKATLWVNRALAVGENTAACFALRGVIAVRGGNLRAGITSLTAATRADPLNARWYFYLVQMLRRGGKLQEAEQRLVQAIQRVEEPQQEEYFHFVLRLTRIELGQAERILPELRTKLALPAPPSDWLLTAAAIELQRGRLDQAAELMGRAFKNQSPAYAASRLDDVYFRNFETTKELSPLYAAYLPRGSSAPDLTATSRTAALVSPGLMPSATLMQQPPGQAAAPLLFQPRAQPSNFGTVFPAAPEPGVPPAIMPPAPGPAVEPTPGDKP